MSGSARRSTSLGDQANVKVGFAFPSDQFVSGGDRPRLLRGMNVKRGRLDWSGDNEKRWGGTCDGLDAYALSAGDLVIAMDGALVGRSYATVSREDLPAYLVQRVARVRAKDRRAQSFIRHMIGSRRFVAHVDRVKTHTAVPHISGQNIEDFTFPALSIDTQARFGQLFDCGLALELGLEKGIAARRAFKRGLMQQLLTGQKRFPEFGAHSQCEAPPADWRKVRLADVVQIRVSNVDKHVHEGEQRVPLCNYMDVWRNDHITADLPFMNGAATGAEIQKFGLRVGDVLLTKDSETPEEIAKSAVVESVVAGLTLGYHVALLRPDEEQVAGEFLAAQLAVGRFRKHFVRKAAGATRFGLSIGALESAEAWLPSVAEQRRIAAVNRNLHSEIELLAAKREKLEVFRRALLSKLLSGSLPVPP